MRGILCLRWVARLLGTAVFLQLSCDVIPSHAQIQLDNQTPTEIEVVGNESTISGGSVSGPNQFHSFDSFSIPAGDVVTFEALPDVSHIINRVTGDSISAIDGEIRYTGDSASIFLINPNGIVFGPESTLNVNASFIATTADGIAFQDGSFWGVSGETSQAPLLTSSIPLGLQFGEEPGSIHSQARTIFQPDLSMLPEELLNDPEFVIPPIPVGLEVSPNHTLALVGGDVTVEGDVESIATAFEGFAALQAPSGRVEVGSVGSGERVSLTPVEVGWVLGYNSVSNFRDVTLSGALLQASSRSESFEAIQVQGNTVEIANDTQINSLNEIGSVSSQPIVVNAADSIELSEGSSITTAIFDGSGTAGDIILQSDRLSVLSDSAIDASSQGTGTGGRVIIDAIDMVEVGEFSFISTTGFGDGDAGSISITTEHLSLFDIGLIASSNRAAGAGSSGTGDAGTLTIKAESVMLADDSQLQAAAAFGKGGSISINVQNLIEFKRGASVSTSIGAESGGSDSGNIDIDATFLVAVPHENSDIVANAFDGSGGNVNINPGTRVYGFTSRGFLT
ncbi:MAG: filamentous hemagglutinin N-terminal domain-containing protein, partial [Cyanobacteria bacterium P01_F01_bin.33]